MREAAAGGCNDATLGGHFLVTAQAGEGSGDVEDAARRFTTIYGEHYPKVLAYLLTRVDRQVAEDLAAETFVVVWRRLGQVPARPLPWVLGVARNVLREQRRASGRRAALAGRVSALTGCGDRSDRDVAALRAVGGDPFPDPGRAPSASARSRRRQKAPTGTRGPATWW